MPGSLYKDWRAICALTNVHLKLLVSLATDEEFLKKLARGFPELFTDEEPDQKNGLWPLSVLRMIVAESIRNDPHPDSASIISAYDELSSVFPWVGACGPLTSEGFSDPLILTREEAQQVSYYERLDDRGVFPFGLIKVAVQGNDYYIGMPVNDYVDSDTIRVYLFPCVLVDEKG